MVNNKKELHSVLEKNETNFFFKALLKRPKDKGEKLAIWQHLFHMYIFN